MNNFTKNREQFKRFKIGKYTYGFPTIRCFYGDPSKLLVIGNYCSIGERVTFMLNENHDLDWVTTYPPQCLGIKDMHMYPKGKGVTIVNNDVWIAEGSTILSGKIIGNGAIIGTNTLVTSDVPDYAIFGGNPGKVLKYRFDSSTIEKLLKIAWWNWPVNKIMKHREYIFSNKINEFIELCERNNDN